MASKPSSDLIRVVARKLREELAGRRWFLGAHAGVGRVIVLVNSTADAEKEVPLRVSGVKVHVQKSNYY